jgi:predicted transcriptional regulator
MKARDVMVSPVITVKSHALVQEVAKTLVDGRISAVPVVDDVASLSESSAKAISCIVPRQAPNANTIGG